MAAPSKKDFKILIISVICLSDMCVLNVKGAGSLVTTPPAIDGVLTSCGETRLTCSHDDIVGQTTTWAITHRNSTIVCQEIIAHGALAPPYACNEFNFVDITPSSGAVSDLNSTAIVNPLPLSLDGSQMECFEGTLPTALSAGSVTLCAIDQLSHPMGVRSVPLQNNLTFIVLEWETFSQATCSRDTVAYTIAIDGVEVTPDNITALSSTSYIVSGLEANRMYTASVRTVISNCMSDQTNITFQIVAQTPTPVVDTRFFCANSSDSITLTLSMTFPSSAPSGVVYPPTSELSITVNVSDSSGLVSNTTFPASQSVAFFNLRNNESYTLSVEAGHDTTGPSTPITIPLTTFIFDVDTSTTSLDDRVTARLNDSCVENPTTFISTLSYGSCPDYVAFQESQTFSGGTAVFVLDLSSVTGNLCIRVVVAHESQSNPPGPLNTLERKLIFNSCQTASITSLAGSRVSIQFSSPENSTTGTVAHGTVATFGSTSHSYTLVGPSRSICRNGVWTDLVERRTKLAGWVIAVIVVIILFVAACVGGCVTGYLVWCFCCSHKEKSKDTIELNEKEKLDEADGNHELSPARDEYAVVDKSSKRKPAAAAENQALYQDPNSIQHETAPTGDVYAVTEKKQKKKGPTEAELAQMYSVPDKTKGSGLNYASLDMPAGGEAKRPAPTEYATVIN